MKSFHGYARLLAKKTLMAKPLDVITSLEKQIFILQDKIEDIKTAMRSYPDLEVVDGGYDAGFYSKSVGPICTDFRISGGYGTDYVFPFYNDPELETKIYAGKFICEDSYDSILISEEDLEGINPNLVARIMEYFYRMDDDE